MRRALLVLVLLLLARSGWAAGCAGTGNCFFVGGTGNTTVTTKWATTSGGATTGGQPTVADNCIFDSASNASAYTVTVNATLNCKSVSIAAPLSGDMTLAGTGAIQFAGNFTRYAGMVRTYTGPLNYVGTSGTQTITSNGGTWASAVVVNNAGAIATNADAFTTTGLLTMTAGTLTPGAAFRVGSGGFSSASALDTSGADVTFDTSFSASGGSVRSWNPGSRTININGSGTPWSWAGVSNLTVAANTATTIFTNSAGAIMSGGSSTAWGGMNFTFAGSGAGAYAVAGGSQGYGTITISNTGAAPFSITATANKTFVGLIFAAGYTGAKSITTSQTIGTLQFAEPNTTLTLTSGTTQTITTPLISGTVGNLNILAASGATNATIATSAPVSLDYMSISKINCVGGGLWAFGPNSVDGGSNSACTFPTNRKAIALSSGGM